MIMRLFAVAFVGSLSVAPLRALEVRVVRFQTLAPDYTPPPCLSFQVWSSQTFFLNTTDVPQVVRFLGVSNGDPRSNPRPLTIAPKQGVSIGGFSGLDWEPAQPSILWVNRLDVPQGVVFANRITTFVADPDHPETPCTGKNTRYAGLPLPIASTLTPAGNPQYFLGLDVGSSPADIQITNARINAGIYNGGGVPATATINVYCGGLGSGPLFGNTLFATAVIQIPANTLIQQAVATSAQAASCPTAGSSFWYATVTADQPSFSYAIGLSNATLTRFPAALGLSSSQ